MQKNEVFFEHDDVTSKLCPEAVGHFCMLWGEHGHGGYDSQARGYIQGGQQMDETFELMGIYVDFEQARDENDWQRMRLAITELRQMRAELNITQTQERELREES